MGKTSNLFFHPTYSFLLQWGKHTLRIGSLGPGSKDQINNAIKDLSQESIRNRFLGSKKEFSEKELDYFTTVDGWDHYAIGVEEELGNKRGVAVIRMVRSKDNAHEAEVAITIIDDYQNMGLGTLLMELIIMAAQERGIERLSFSCLPQNNAIIKLISKFAPPEIGPHQMDYVQSYMDLAKVDRPGIKERLKKILPEIGAFHLGI